MGDHFSPHKFVKRNWTLSKLHKTISECWQRTSGTQKDRPLSSKGGHLYLLPPPSLLYPTLWISLCVPGCGEYLENWLLARSVSSPFDSPFSPPGHLYLLPPSSLLYVTSWTSLRVPDCGEHIRNWLLARLLSLLLISPLLLLVTSISPLPLLFFM